MSFTSNSLTVSSDSVHTPPSVQSQSEENSPFSLSKHRPEEISKIAKYDEELQADRLSIQLKQKMAFKGVSDSSDEFETLMSKGGAIQLQIKEMIKTTKQNINDRLKVLMEEESYEPSNVLSAPQDPVLRRGQTIAVRSSKTLKVEMNEVIAEANEDDDDSLKTDIDDEDTNKDEDLKYD